MEQLKNIVKPNELDYKAKNRKKYSFSKYYLTLKDADEEQINLVNELKSIKKVQKKLKSIMFQIENTNQNRTPKPAPRPGPEPTPKEKKEKTDLKNLLSNNMKHL